MFLNKFTKAFGVCNRLPSLLLSIALVCYCSFVTAASSEAEECAEGILLSHTRALHFMTGLSTLRHTKQ